MHAIAKAVVSYLDKNEMDSNQDKIETILQNCIGSTKRTWPTVFNNKIIKVEGEDKRFRAVFEIELKFTIEEVTTKLVNLEKGEEYVFCTTQLSRNDLHSVYIDGVDEKTGMLKCINSWGRDEPTPKIQLIQDKDNKIFKIGITKLNSMEKKSIDQETDFLRMLAKKDEQIRIQDELMSRGKEEILRLRVVVTKLEAEKEEFRQRLAVTEKADRELEEAKEDPKFRARQQEVGNLLKRYEASFLFKYRKFILIHGILATLQSRAVVESTKSSEIHPFQVLEPIHLLLASREVQIVLPNCHHTARSFSTENATSVLPASLSMSLKVNCLHT